jgi:precorrin-2 dehydrogenase
MEKNFLPVSIDISGQKILIIGGGQSALKKINILKRFEADLEVVALKVRQEIKQSGVRFSEKEYDPGDLKGFLMVYSCSNNPELDKKIVDDCKKSGVLINIHDNPAMCQFISPAIYKDGHMTVAVSSNGRDVFNSIRIRDLIQKFLQPEFY